MIRRSNGESEVFFEIKGANFQRQIRCSMVTFLQLVKESETLEGLRVRLFAHVHPRQEKPPQS